MELEPIFFKSEAHKARFLAAVQEAGKIDGGKLDSEYTAALYILTADSGTWNKASGYAGRSGIRFEELLSEVDFSHGYAVLIRLAANLFNEFDDAGKQARPVDLMILDEGNFKVAMSAFQLRRRNYPLSFFQQGQGAT